MSEPGTAPWRRAEASRLIAFERAAALASGGWWQELAPDMTPATSTWSGKPDLYHSYQAVLFPSLPLSPTAATALARLGPS